MAARLSVIVPYYNVERYLRTALDSVRHQTFTDLEVVLVDDGSRDGSRLVAEEFCAVDPRFSLVTQENQGLGPARNTGLAHASGELVTFVDSDDFVPRHAYELMVTSLDESGSDLVAGDARRFTSLWVRDSHTHKNAFAETLQRTHVRDQPVLIHDRMAWNKIYRRDFLEANDLVFPGMLYEDYPLTIKAHVRARTVDALKHPVYYWREREGGEPSITQARHELSNVSDRVRSAEIVLDYLRDEAPELSPVVERHLMATDLDAVVAALHEARPDELTAMVGLGRRLLSRFSGPVRDLASPFERVQAELLEREDLPRLRQLVDYRDEHGTSAPVVRVGRVRRRYQTDLPFRGDPEAAVPSTCYDVPSPQQRLFARADDASWNGGVLTVSGTVHMPGTETSASSDLRLWLAGKGDARVELEPRRRHVQMTDLGSQLAGFDVEINPFLLGGGSTSGAWRLNASLRDGRSRGETTVGAAGGTRAWWARSERLSGDHVAQPQVLGDGVWGVNVRDPKVRVTRVTALGDRLEITGSVRARRLPDDAVLTVSRHAGPDVPVHTDLEERPDGVHRFVAVVRVSDVHDGGLIDPIEEVVPWSPRFHLGSKAHPVALSPEFVGTFVRAEGAQVRASQTRAGNLVLHEGPVSPGVEGIEWEDGLHVRGVLARDDTRSAELQLVRHFGPARSSTVTVPLELRDGTFEGVLDPMTLVEGERDGGPAARSHRFRPWQCVLVEDGAEQKLILPRDVLGRLPGARTVGDRRVSVAGGRGDTMAILVVPA